MTNKDKVKANIELCRKNAAEYGYEFILNRGAIMLATGLSGKQVKTALQQLVAEGYIDKVPKGATEKNEDF